MCRITIVRNVASRKGFIPTYVYLNNFGPQSEGIFVNGRRILGIEPPLGLKLKNRKTSNRFAKVSTNTMRNATGNVRRGLSHCRWYALTVSFVSGGSMIVPYHISRLNICLTHSMCSVWIWLINREADKQINLERNAL